MKLLYTIKYQLDEFDPNKNETLIKFTRRLKLITRRLTGRLRDYTFCKRCKQKARISQVVGNICKRCIKKEEDRYKKETVEGREETG